MLEVSRRPAADEKLAERVWHFKIGPAASSIQAYPGKCYRYGIAPAAAEQRGSKALQPQHIYTVDIKAKHKGTNLKGFQAEFCMRPVSNGKFQVVSIPWDEKNNKWNYEVCELPR
jgi:hypothetical protein